jgi:UDP-N-acetyl-D-glucosamine dehydrogenase
MTTIKDRLISRFAAREATVGIVGMGYVGLPLVVEFARVGYHVIGMDVSAEKVTKLNRCESYIPDIPTEYLAPLVESGHLRATTKIEYVAGILEARYR